jgi:GNAT superfamily N-acetyltransferase
MNVIYRIIRKDELPALLELYKHLHETDLPLPDNKTVKRIWNEILTDNKMKCIVAEVDNRIAATCILVIVPNLTRGGHSYGLIENVVTLIEYRKKGIGTGLLQYAQQLAWDSGCYKVMLMTGRQRDEIFRFYEKAGFRRGTKTAFIIEKSYKM